MNLLNIDKSFFRYIDVEVYLKCREKTFSGQQTWRRVSRDQLSKNFKLYLDEDTKYIFCMQTYG